MSKASLTGKRPGILPETSSASAHPTHAKSLSWQVKLGLAALVALAWLCFDTRGHRFRKHNPAPVLPTDHDGRHGWASFPRKDDPFHFLPCTNETLPPPRLEDPYPLESWKQLYQPDPTRWLRGETNEQSLYLCGWLDVPLDYTNASDPRVARLAINRFQLDPLPSNRTLVVHPGGGESGTQFVLSEGELISEERSNKTFDVLGWDPRGALASQPLISCFPHNADRDRWKLLTTRSYKEGDPRQNMLVADAMNEAVFKACQARYGDVAGMLTIAFVARDLEEIRGAIQEDQLNGYFVSYGTEIAQTYVNMFPHRVGRLVLDGNLYARNDRLLAGFGTSGLDNVTNSYHDGFLGECVDAGPENCALAQPLQQGDPLVTKQDLIDVLQHLFARLLHRPIAGYTDKSGPVIITYSQLVKVLLLALHDPFTWDDLAAALYELLRGDATLISQQLDTWDYDPAQPALPSPDHAQLEMMILAICSDQYDSPLPAGYDVDTNGEQWYLDIWRQLTHQAEIGADRGFLWMLACRHWNSTFAPPKEVYRGDLNHTLSNPLLLIGTTYDPATPLRNARMLLQEMGDNARLIVHHGYGHLSDDKSTCTERMVRSYLMDGIVPQQQETHCFADQKPYRYDNNMRNRSLSQVNAPLNTCCEREHTVRAESDQINL
ncbi:hypothetical protein EX895_004128 [Sporisorium graminicola]|uniref:Peptidase S33 tripeptidyl aminopeptidase-like C-terminal domain-containing protein n=1 Tax=Sporisorium graminicola TaxID=280036 RepID=A0A4U7KQZ1_9BASI|nr:hypothetical protein EX895_004128 [Sporisorium graminicola]TKY86841.1 hypothetical protein EX895_004128 [Sporisorium graminicola]